MFTIGIPLTLLAVTRDLRWRSVSLAQCDGLEPVSSLSERTRDTLPVLRYRNERVRLRQCCSRQGLIALAQRLLRSRQMLVLIAVVRAEAAFRIGCGVHDACPHDTTSRPNCIVAAEWSPVLRMVFEDPSPFRRLAHL